MNNFFLRILLTFDRIGKLIKVAEYCLCPNAKKIRF